MTHYQHGSWWVRYVWHQLGTIGSCYAAISTGAPQADRRSSSFLDQTHLWRYPLRMVGARFSPVSIGFRLSIVDRLKNH